MKTLFFAAILALMLCNDDDLLVTRESTEELKKRVTWQVADYDKNVFKGWTVGEFKKFLGKKPRLLTDGKIPEGFSIIDTSVKAPASVDRTSDQCTHSIRDQSSCGCCWAFTVAGLMSDYCCTNGKDYGWLSPQELTSCCTSNQGCNGGLNINALNYARDNGLVPESCYPYLVRQENCPSACTNGNAWASSHVCKCPNPTLCGQTLDGWKNCLVKGQMASGMTIYADFNTYSGGVYCWDQKSARVGDHAVRCVGYSDDPSPHLKCANSWGTGWGEKGFFRISTSANCGLMYNDNDWSICDGGVTPSNNNGGTTITTKSFSAGLAVGSFSMILLLAIAVIGLFA